MIQGTDEQLVSYLQQGDESAFAALFVRYQRPIYNHVCRLMKDQALAEDLTQETFMKALTHLDQVHTPASLNAWLHRVATNLCLNEFRRGTPSRTTDTLPEILADERPDPFVVVARQQMVGLVRVAMERLPLRYREVLQMRLFEELDYEIVAERMEVTHAHAQVLYCRARQRLKSEYRRLLTERHGRGLCRDTTLIPTLLENRLAPAEHERLSSHVINCPTCAQVADDWLAAVLPA